MILAEIFQELLKHIRNILKPYWDLLQALARKVDKDLWRSFKIFSKILSILSLRTQSSTLIRIEAAIEIVL